METQIRDPWPFYEYLGNRPKPFAGLRLSNLEGRPTSFHAPISKTWTKYCVAPQAKPGCTPKALPPQQPKSWIIYQYKACTTVFPQSNLDAQLKIIYPNRYIHIYIYETLTNESEGLSNYIAPHFSNTWTTCLQLFPPISNVEAKP